MHEMRRVKRDKCAVCIVKCAWDNSMNRISDSFEGFRSNRSKLKLFIIRSHFVRSICFGFWSITLLFCSFCELNFKKFVYFDGVWISRISMNVNILKNRMKTMTFVLEKYSQRIWFYQQMLVEQNLIFSGLDLSHLTK